MNLNRQIVLIFFLCAAPFLSGCLRPTKTVTIRVAKFATPSDPFHSPLKKFKVLSPFGPRNDWYHTGVDIRWARREGDPVLASREGIVTQAGTMRGYGNIVTIKHNDGFKTRYAHLKKITATKGKRVRVGQEIGTVGQTGRATGPHLHFEIITPEGRYIDPMTFIGKFEK